MIDGNPKLHNPNLDGDSFFWKAGPVGIFLSHGFTATTAEVRLLAEKLHGNEYTVAAPLLPGHGTQPEDLNHVHWRDWVRTGNETLQKLFRDCEQVFVAGVSMGGVLALYLASEEPLIAGVLLYAPAIHTNTSRMDLVKLYLSAPFITQVERKSLDCPDVWQGYPGLPIKGIIQFLRFQTSTINRLSHIHQPVLIFQGNHDSVVSPQARKIIMEGISSRIKEHHWLRKSSHAITLDVECSQAATLSIQFIEKVTEIYAVGTKESFGPEVFY